MKHKVMEQNKIIKAFTSKWRFMFFLLWKLPMAFFANLKVEELDDYKSNVSVPYNYLNKNPFKSMYFAVQSMAGELSTGCLVILHTDGKNISTLVTNIEANFHKKAINTINFICLDGEKALIAIKKACDTNKSQKCIMVSKGYNEEGECVSEFTVTWSLKKRN